jgi:hypothetical protein
MFPDPYFEEAIRKAINKPEGEITPEDCQGITKLDYSG